MHVARSAWFLCLATLAVAEEKPSAVPPAPPPEDSIEAARRDLETIKAAKGGVEQARADVPRFTAPEFGAGSQAPARPITPLSPLEAAAAKKSANWLVDAMMKKPARTSDGKDRPAEDSRDQGAKDQGDRKALSAGDDKDAADDAAQRRAPRKPVDPALNPLTSFMSGWMSAQDYKLLQPGLSSETSANLVARGESSSYLPSTTGGTALANIGRTPPPSATATPPKENPFLQAFTVPPGPTAGSTGFVQPAPVPVMAASKATPPPVAAPPQNSAIPSFVKPNEDAKYFKPLKRF